MVQDSQNISSTSRQHRNNFSFWRIANKESDNGPKCQLWTYDGQHRQSVRREWLRLRNEPGPDHADPAWANDEVMETTKKMYCGQDVSDEDFTLLA